MSARRPRFNQLGQLPWSPTMQVAIVTVAIVVILEQLLRLGVGLMPEAMARPLVEAIVGNGPLPILVNSAIDLGIGALAVLIYGRWKVQIRLNGSILWALVGCLLLALFIRSTLPPPILISDLSELSALGILLGVFWCGRPYWQRWG